MRAGTLILLAILSVPTAGGAAELSVEHRAIDFLAGHWVTASRYPDSGLEAPGDLT